MSRSDQLAYYTLIASILLGVLVVNVVQLRDLAASIRPSGGSATNRLSFLALIVVSIVSVTALAQIPPAARGASSWLTYNLAETLLTMLQSISLLPPLLTAGGAAFSRRRPISPAALSNDVHPAAPTSLSAARLMLLALIIYASRRRRR